MQSIEYSPEYHRDLRKIFFVRELRVIRVPRFTEVRYHCRSAKSYRSSGPDLKARRAGRCAAEKAVHAYGVAACNNSAIDYPGPGSRGKQVHFRKTALVLCPVYSIYSPSSPPVRPPILGQALSKRTLCDGMFPDYRLDYAETQRRQGDALLRSDSSSPFTSREFLPPLVHPLAYVATRIALRRYGDYVRNVSNFGVTPFLLIRSNRRVILRMLNIDKISDRSRLVDLRCYVIDYWRIVVCRKDCNNWSKLQS